MAARIMPAAAQKISIIMAFILSTATHINVSIIRITLTGVFLKLLYIDIKAFIIRDKTPITLQPLMHFPHDVLHAGTMFQVPVKT